MTTNEVIDACGRAPSGSEVVVRLMQQSAVFAVASFTLEYDAGGWRVVLNADLNDPRPVA